MKTTRLKYDENDQYGKHENDKKNKHLVYLIKKKSYKT